MQSIEILLVEDNEGHMFCTSSSNADISELDISAANAYFIKPIDGNKFLREICLFEGLGIAPGYVSNS